MGQSQRKSKQELTRAKLIYNPRAGQKRRLFSALTKTSLEEIKQLLKQYQILVDYFPTKYPKHATKLAKEAEKEGYKMVIAAGGDGTVGEVANGLVGSEIILGVIPLGSFMNIARMFSIPLDLEKAIMLLKIGRSRKIDVGVVTRLGGEKLEEPYYFIEACGLGLEAQMHKYVLDFENGRFGVIFEALKALFDYYGHSAKITIDGERLETRATIVTVSNGPYASAAIPFAPNARLNDHKLTVRLFKMSKYELFRFFAKVMRGDKYRLYKVETYQGDKVRIETKVERLVHADARLYGTTPVEFKILPNALNVIAGFPEDKEDTALIKRTYLDP